MVKLRLPIAASNVSFHDLSKPHRTYLPESKLSQTEKSTQDFAIARPAVLSSSSTVPSANAKPSPLAKQSTTPTESTRATLKANESGAKLPTELAVAF